jgi:hypothetical protein
MHWILDMVGCTDKIGVLDVLEGLFKIKQHLGPMGLPVRACADLSPPRAISNPPAGTIIAHGTFPGA